MIIRTDILASKNIDAELKKTLIDMFDVKHISITVDINEKLSTHMYHITFTGITAIPVRSFLDMIRNTVKDITYTVIVSTHNDTLSTH